MAKAPGNTWIETLSNDESTLNLHWNFRDDIFENDYDKTD